MKKARSAIKIISQMKKARSAIKIISPDSYHRLDRIRSLVDQYYGNINIEIAKKILADYDQNQNSICRHMDSTVPISSTTLASFIMVPGEGVYIYPQAIPANTSMYGISFRRQGLTKFSTSLNQEFSEPRALIN